MLWPKCVTVAKTAIRTKAAKASVGQLSSAIWDRREIGRIEGPSVTSKRIKALAATA